MTIETGQLDLDSLYRARRRGTIQERFDTFHHNHPEVYRELVELAWTARRHGRHRIGIGHLFEVLRWQRMIRGLPDPAEGVKLNNDYRSRYARLIMAREPGLDGMFETRQLTADD